jgi:hypothetical protein
MSPFPTAKAAGAKLDSLVRAEVQFIYDLNVDADGVPKPYDMEASSIDLYSIDEIKKALEDGEFTLANACLKLVLFIWHGMTTLSRITLRL